MRFEKIRDFENYSITENGEVFSQKTNRYLKKCIRNGYYNVSLCSNGKKINKHIHRLVAEQFIENKNGYPQINHKDGNKLNNNLINLEWCTSSENIKHSFRVLGRQASDGGQSKPVICLETKIIYQSISECAKNIGVNIGTLSKHLMGKRYTCKKHHYMYKN